LDSWLVVSSLAIIIPNRLGTEAKNFFETTNQMGYQRADHQVPLHGNTPFGGQA